MTTNRCIGTNKEGYTCKRPAMHGSLYCMSHDPSLTEKVNASTAIAVEAHKNNRRLKKLSRVDNVDDVIVVLKTTLQNLARKTTLTTKETANVASLSNTLMRALEKQAVFRRIEEVEARKKLLGK